MSEPVARQRPMIDLDEFERRLRRPAASPAPRNEDPLAELARLVGDERDPYHGMFQESAFQEKAFQERRFQENPAQQNHEQNSAARVRVAAGDRFAGAGNRAEQPPRVAPNMSPRIPPRGLAPTAEPAEDWGARTAEPIHGSGRGNGLPPAPRNASQSRGQALGGNFAAIEAGLRGSIQPEFRSAGQDYEPAFQQSYQQHYDPHWEEEPAPEEDDADWLDQAQSVGSRHVGRAPERPRSRRLLYMTAAIILVGIGGIGATFAIKRSPVSPAQIAMIKASTIPAKIQAPTPPATAGAKIIQDASVLDKTPQPMPVGLVNRTEQPVDVAQAEAASTNGAGQQSAASVPVPQPPAEAGSGGQAATPSWQQGRPGGTQVADAAPGQAFGLGSVIQPTKVKTVTVRPDGTIVSGDAPEAAPPVSGSPDQPPVGAANENDAAPKTAERATPSGARAAERDALVADRTGSTAVADTPVKPKTVERAKRVRVADIPKNSRDATASGSHAGDFSVQLGAPATEAEARHAVGQLARRYASALGGRPLKWHRAKVNGKSVYRIRVGGLSKPAAVTLCESLKAKGGSCFIARD
ncbi:MAG: SPOR domain-containing protein [Methylovirgula sp.]